MPGLSSIFSNLFLRRKISEEVFEMRPVSPGKIAWRRFRRNRLAMGAVILVGICVFLALTAYLITPDKTPYANRQFLELARKKPGFRVDMIRVTRNGMPEEKGWVQKVLFGKEDQWSLIPVDTAWYEGSNLKYIPYGGGLTGEVSLADLLFRIDTREPVVFDGQMIGFRMADGTANRISLTEARAKADALPAIIKKRFLLGSDKYGRDMLSQLIVGMRVSLSVGFVAVLISLLLGISLGAFAGYFGGRVDRMIMWFINVIWSMPSLLLVIAITFALGKGFWQVFLAIGLTMWVEVARVTRGQIISIREKEFVEAGKALGFSHGRILFRHVLPNVLSPVIVISAANFATAILLEAGLSFLGIGVQPPMPSWGTMIRDHAGYIILDSAYLAFLPGLAIMIMVLSFMVAGNGLRDALDVRD